MYDFKCDKKFDLELNVPDFSTRYSELLHSTKKNIIIIKDKFDHSTFRYRGYNVIQTMKNNEKYNVVCFLVEELHLLYGLLDKIEFVILQRARWSFEINSFISVLKGNNIKIVYDIDDLIYNSKYVPKYLNSIGDYRDQSIDHFFAYSKRYEIIAEMCDAFIVTTDKLYEKVKEDFNKPTWIFHNYLNLEQQKASDEVIKLKNKTYSNDKFVIGYFSGSPSHKRDLEIIEPAIVKLMNDYEDIYLKIVGYMDVSPELKKFKDEGRVIFSKFVSFEELQYEIGMVDLNIIPLQKHEFNDCKSELKYFEASIVNTLTCATDNAIYKNVIEDGVDGFLSDEISWYKKIEFIYLNYDKLDIVVENARKKCYRNYGNKEQEKGLEELYDDIIDKLVNN